ILVPDAEARRRPPGIGALRRATAETGIDADRDLLAGRDLPVLLQLMERARVEEDAAADVLGEPARGYLGGELDASRGEPGLERPLHLEVARRVHVQPQVAEEHQDAVARVRLHRVSQRQAVRRGKGEGLAGRRLEAGTVVDVTRRAE